MNTLFWCSLVLLVYPLAGYPLILTLLRRLKGRALSAPALPPESLPSVSVLLSVYNEERVIGEKIANFLALDYPADRLELLVVSDGSADGTDALVLACADPRVRLIRQPERRGKTEALNRAAREAAGEILFFTDADAMLKPDCLRKLMRPFADPRVGLVSGRSVYLDATGRETEGSLYRRYEEWLKEQEGLLYGIAGADGAVYALRTSLYAPLPPEYINDLAHPVQVVLDGRYALTRADAVVTERSEETDHAAEFNRQTRIMAQAWLIFLGHATKLVLAGRWGFLWQFVSHKVLRWLAAPLMVLLLLSAVNLRHAAAWLALAGLVLLCLGAILGRKGLGGVGGRVCSLFMLQSVAGLYGLARLMHGDTFVTWKPRGK